MKSVPIIGFLADHVFNSERVGYYPSSLTRSCTYLWYKLEMEMGDLGNLIATVLLSGVRVMYTFNLVEQTFTIEMRTKEGLELNSYMMEHVLFDLFRLEHASR